jgi:acyl phosphate:glycerol-3-phosphate acyltransferase
MMEWALLALAYGVGATPTSYWVARGFHGVDLRRVGSGNLGATNTYRILGWKAALPVGLFDVLKGWLPVVLFPSLAGVEGALWPLAFGGAAIVGHVCSFWVGFRGGKGVATSAGVFLGLAPWAFLVGFVVWFTTVLLTRYVSLGSILAALVLPPAVLLTPHRGGEAAVVFTVLLAVFVLWTHRENIRRLLDGSENRIGRSLPGMEGPNANEEGVS